MAKTLELPGVEGEGVAQKKIIALDNAVLEWRGFVDKRMALTKKEVEASQRVLEVMHAKGVTSYRYQDGDTEKMLVLVAGKEKVKLKALGDDSGGEEDTD